MPKLKLKRSPKKEKPKLPAHCENHGTVFIRGVELKEICSVCGTIGSGHFVGDHSATLKMTKYGCIVANRSYLHNSDESPISDAVFDHERRTLLHWAARYHNHWLIRKILSEGNIDVNVRNKFNKTPLMVACDHSFCYPENSGVKKNVVKTPNDHANSLLTHEDHIRTCELLLEYGANVNAIDTEKKRPLFYAILADNFKVVQLLLKHGANANSRMWCGNTVLHLSVQKPDQNITKYLISQGKCDINELDLSECTPLVRAFITHDSLEKVQTLVENGARIVEIDETIWSPLHSIFTCTNQNTIDYVLTKAAEVMKMSREQLLDWMFQPPFCEVVDRMGYNWVFKCLQRKVCNHEILEKLLSLETVSFSAIGPFGIRLDSIIYDRMKQEQIYKERTDDFQKLFEKLRNKAKRTLSCSKETYDNEDCHSVFDVQKPKYMLAETLLNIIEKLTSVLVTDWLRPVLWISHFLYQDPIHTVCLAPQVQLAFQPHDGYKGLLDERNEKEESLLHVSAKSGNERAVHLMLLLGMKNSSDRMGRLPYQLAEQFGYYELADFLLIYYEMAGTRSRCMTENDKDLLRGTFVLVTGELTFHDVDIYSDIPDFKETVSKLKDMAAGKSVDVNINIQQSTSEQIINLQDLPENERLPAYVNSEVDRRFPGCNKVYTDGSAAHKPESFSGSSYYNEISDDGMGYPIYPHVDIHESELLAVKIALEESDSQSNTVVLSDRQKMISVLEKLTKVTKDIWFHKDRTDNPNYILLNWLILCRLKFPVNRDVSYGLQWVPAHRGIKGNEIADELAKSAWKQRRIVLRRELTDNPIENRRDIEQ